MKFTFNNIFSVAGHIIGKDNPVFIIAEAGVAHLGNFDKAMRLVDLAVESKADAVKFQIFRTDELIAIECEEWQNRLRSKEIPFESFRDIQDFASLVKYF
jgi:N-acetylneuraminate synthase/N,N'-diacetyllegionaminate synthase|tara:strand:- start:117 stop:416 length:300 start_codon:yes stop_codon:yes gene_type:complete